MHQQNIQSWLAGNKQPIPKKPGGTYEIRRINDHPHIKITVPIGGETDTSLVWVQTVVVVSEAAYDAVIWRIVRAVLIIIAVVISTTILLYPVIIRLLNKLSRLSINLLDANLEIIKVLGSAIAKKDSDTDAHNYRVTLMAVKLAESVGLDDDSIEETLNSLMDKGLIYEPILGTIKTT